MDEDGYPEDEELETIKTWDHKKGWPALMEYVQSLWHWGPDYFHPQAHCEGRWEAHTGGWSGNESIIGALMENQLFWVMCWLQSRRGGHFEFEVVRSVLPKRTAE